MSDLPDRATIILDENGVIAAWDRFAEKHLGYSSKEAVGKHPSDFAPPQMLALPKSDQIREHSKLYGHYERYHMVGRKSGKFFLAKITAQIERGANEQLLTIIWITPVQPGSGGPERMVGAASPLPSLEREPLHEFNNLLMVLLGSAELLEDQTRSLKVLDQQLALLRAAASRTAEIWPKLQAFIEFWQDVNSIEVNGSAGQRGTKSTK